jgi:hypothetical protein
MHGRDMPDTTSYRNNSAASTAPEAGVSSEMTAERRKTPLQLDGADHFEDPASNLHQLFEGAMKAMQLRNSQALLNELNKITRVSKHELQEAIATLPRTTFSEFLRCLDPNKIARDNDPTHGVTINPGMWQMLNLGAVIDEWGTRLLYTRLLRQLLILMRALEATNQVLGVNDYVSLLRAAGLASDMTVAKLLWEQMKVHNLSHWRNYGIYQEFIKARFLTDPAYYGFNQKILTMNPRDLHRQGRVMLVASTSRLDRLRKNYRSRMFKFGLNKNVVDYAQDLSRNLRKRLPPTRMFSFIQMKGVRMTEELLCNLMVAFSRAGSLRFIQYRILEDYFGIAVKKDNNTGSIYVDSSKPRQRSTKWPFRPPRPFLMPTARLLDAVVYAYCSNGQLSMAFNIIEFISKRYRIPIDRKVWFDLLEWCHILSTPPTSTAWRIAGLNDRVPSQNAVENIWNTMTMAPHYMKPGFKQYDIFITNRLFFQKIDEALEYMREARRFYDIQCAKYDATAFEYAAAKRAGLSCTKQVQAFRRARFLKSYMRQRMNTWCTLLLEKSFRPQGLHDSLATQGIPELVEAWRDILTNPVRYRTASGWISLYDPAEPIEQTIFVRDHIIHIPRKRQGQWGLKTMIQRQFRLMSKYDLGDLLSARRHPLEIWKGAQPKGRPAFSRRLQKHLSWVAEQEREATAIAELGHDSNTQLDGDAPDEQDIWDDDD